MKKFILMLVFLLSFMFVFSGIASAMEIKAKGSWRVHANYVMNTDFDKDTKYDRFNAWQRARTVFEFIASDNLKGVLQFEIGDTKWGKDDGALNTDGKNIKTKHAYLDFNVFDTQVKAGLQPIALPSVFGSHILSADVAAFLVSKQVTDMFGVTLGWARPYDQEDIHPYRTDKHWNDEVDVFLMVVPVTMNGLKLNPFVVMSNFGKDFLGEESNAKMYHGGLNFEVLMFNPFVLKGDFNYGYVKWNDNNKQSGWVAVLAAQYQMDLFTPEVFGFYETGEDKVFNDSKTMPVIGTDGGAFGPGIGYGSNTEFNMDNLLRSALYSMFDDYQNQEGAMGLKGVGFALRDITLIDKLSHDVVLYYVMGNNHKDNVFLMTTEDKYYEANFNSSYKIYENLSLILETAYGKLKLDDLGTNGRGYMFEDGMVRVVGGFAYKF